MPSSKRESVQRLSEESYEIRVREPAERGLANQRIREVLADFIGVPLPSVRLISGHTSRSKIFSTRD